MARTAGKAVRGVFERPKGSGVWWVRYADQYGTMHREKCGAKSLALDTYKLRKADVLRDKFLPEQVGKQKVVLFDELAEDFLTYSKANNRSYPHEQRRMQRLLAVFGGKPADSIGRDDIERFKLTMAAKMSRASVNRYLALLRATYNRAISESNPALRKVEVSPMHGIKLFKENNARVRYLTEEEEFRLFQSLPERYRPLVAVGLLTGLRAKNLIGLRWRDIDLERGVCTIPLTKSGDTLRLELDPQVTAILKSLPRNGGYVFARANGNPPWDFTHTFTAAVRRAGLSDLRLHDLRHTFASRLAMAGESVRTIQEVGGWKTLSMAQRYAHLGESHRRTALAKLTLTGFTVPTGTTTGTTPSEPVEGITGEVANYAE